MLKIVPNFFLKETYVLHYENLQPYLRIEFKLKNKYIAYYSSINCNGQNRILNLTHKKEMEPKIKKHCASEQTNLYTEKLCKT